YSTKLSSAGLGLHSAANFSVAMGGELKVMSDGPNQGTQIRIRLPLECSRNCYQVRK
ncbi:MAG: ATP-binding protein, partial [Gammaproteobacteria bacterium]|nr:ATP-binding protein [Gammaproteobacteria bacterium]MBT7229323.1 ATP-binding protein [Gammaproteobacteria bacterium]MBT8008169.1 ATP-binding protein [Gammaproteobacteria bacterium]